jgi:2-octaprenylphenol hydroxylase
LNVQSVDVAIVGGGMVGLAVACGLQGSGLRVAVLEQAEPQPLNADAPPALRVSAINAASEKLLTRLDVWPEIIARRASCYHGMEVWDKDSFGHISFDDQSMGFSHLGHIIENASFIMRCGKRRSVAPTSRCWPRLSCSRWRGEKTKHFSACRMARC